MSVVNFDATADSSVLLDTTLTYALTVGTQDDRVLVVSVRMTGGMTVSSITYNGVNLSLIVGANNTGRAEMWGLVNPDSGTHNIVITMSGSSIIISGASSYYGAAQEGQFAVFGSGVNLNTAPTLTLTTVLDDLMVDCLSGISGGSVTPAGGQNARWDDAEGTIFAQSSDKEATSTSTTISYTLGTSQRWIMLGVLVSPVMPPRGSLMMTGVGI